MIKMIILFKNNRISKTWKISTPPPPFRVDVIVKKIESVKKQPIFRTILN